MQRILSLLSNPQILRTTCPSTGLPRLIPNRTASASSYRTHLLTLIRRQVVRPVRDTAGICRFSGVFLGGTGVLSVVLFNKCWVACRADRITSHKSTIFTNQDTVHFDWMRFWLYLQPHLLKLIGAICAALAVAYINIQIPRLLGVFINTLSQLALNNVDQNVKDVVHSLRQPAVYLFCIYLMQSAFTFTYIFLLSHMGEQIAAKLRQDLFHQIIVQDLKFFDENRTGELVNRLTADIQDFKSSFKQCVSQGLRSLAQLIGGTVSLFIISPQMTGIVIVSVPLVVGIMSMLGGLLRKLSKHSQEQTERATMVCEEALANIRTVRSNGSEFFEIQLFNRETDSAAIVSQRLGVGVAVFQALTNLFLNGMVLSTLFVGGHLMASNMLTPGELMAFLVASQSVQRSLSQGSVLFGNMIRGLTSGSRIFEYLIIEPEVDLIEGVCLDSNRLRGEICFRNISFSYPTRPNQQVLYDFNLTIHAGQTVALVGASGSGKSSVACLLERFYEPNSGTITIDGHDLNDLSPHWLRSNVIGFIEQQPILFGTSIMENIRYGRPFASDEDVKEVTRLTQSNEFIMALSDGYETNVGERGTQLSGGQRQRIAIDRAILKQPTILILDEATSALDASSEADVQHALDRIVKNRTTLVIAHRLSTIKNADLIVVLDKGKIVEIGSHNELILKRGSYYRMVHQQTNTVNQ